MTSSKILPTAAGTSLFLLKWCPIVGSTRRGISFLRTRWHLTSPERAVLRSAIHCGLEALNLFLLRFDGLLKPFQSFFTTALSPVYCSLFQFTDAPTMVVSIDQLDEADTAAQLTMISCSSA